MYKDVHGLKLKTITEGADIPKSCRHCDFKTIQQDELYEHVKCHTQNLIQETQQEEELKCVKCDMQIINASEMKKHVKKHITNLTNVNL